MMTLRGIKDWMKANKYMRPVVFFGRVCRGILICHQVVSLLRKLTGHQQLNDVYLILYKYMGDGLIGLSCLDAVRKKYQAKKIFVFCNKKHERLFRTYNGFDELILLDTTSKDYEIIGHFIWKYSVSRKLLKRNIISTIPLHYEGWKYSGLSIFEEQKKYIFGVPVDSPITYHGVKPSEVTSIKDFESVKCKTVIINPYSASCPFYTASLYEDICDYLLSQGYTVYTNVIDDQEAVKGSIPLRCDIYELYSIACSIPLVVSTRSGILDFLSPSNVNMFVLYEKFSSGSYESLRLTGWQCKGKICELNLETREDIASVPEKFSSFLEELKAEGRIS